MNRVFISNRVPGIGLLSAEEKAAPARTAVESRPNVYLLDCVSLRHDSTDTARPVPQMRGRRGTDLVPLTSGMST